MKIEMILFSRLIYFHSKENDECIFVNNEHITNVFYSIGDK